MKRSTIRFITCLFLFISPGVITICQAQSPHPESNYDVDTNVILPPAWAFGILYGGYTNQQETIDRIRQIQAHAYPIDAYWIDSWFWDYANSGRGPDKYIDFVADTSGFPDRKGMWDFMEQNGIKGGFWVWDCILKTGNETAFDDFESRGYFTDIYVNKNNWHNRGTSTAMNQEQKEHPGTLCGNIDFRNPDAAAYFKSRMKHFFDEGADFIKLDRTTDLATCRTMFEMSQEFGKESRGRGFMLSHSTISENGEYKRYPAKWTDDTRSDWTVENPLVEFDSWVPKVAFRENISMFTDPSRPTSEIPFLTNDTGGFDKGYVDRPEEELYIRWLQFSMFNQITEVFSQPENPTANLAWKYSARADSIFRSYAQRRLQLFPYIYSYALRTRLEGRHMIGKFPGHPDQFLFGEEMLLAPVYQKGATTREVYLPDGDWVNFWTGEILRGKTAHSVKAPIHQIPLFIRQGAIIPMRKPAFSVEAGTSETILLEIYAGADGRFTVYEDDGTSNDYLSGKIASTAIEWHETARTESTLKISPVAGAYEDMPSTRTWIIHLHSDRKPAAVEVDGQPFPFISDMERKLALVEVSSNPCDQLLEVLFRF